MSSSPTVDQMCEYILARERLLTRPLGQAVLQIAVAADEPPPEGTIVEGNDGRVRINMGRLSEATVRNIWAKIQAAEKSEAE